jgi:predicted transcriptional regulator
MSFTLRFTREAKENLDSLANSSDAARLAKVRRALARLQADPRYPSLQSHKYGSLRGSDDEEVWDSYVENHTPSAWRIFWHYGPGAGIITVVAITPHP